MTECMLDISGISLSFGGLKAVADFQMKIPPGSLYGLIGPNGAGKTTVFNLLTGIYRADSGTMLLQGKKLNHLKTFEITAVGMARTFQSSRLFAELSVLDNVRTACHLRARHSMAGAILRTPNHRREEKEIREKSNHLLEIFGLRGRAKECAKNLPYGDRRRLEIARALATDPKVLLLDEPAAGMNPQEKFSLQELIRKIRKDFGLTILLIEHDMRLVMGICECIYVLDHGEIIAVGSPQEVQNHAKVIEAYLGAPADAAS